MSMNSSVPRAGHRLPATPSAKGSPSGGHQPRSRRRGRSECGRPAPARPWRGADRRGRLHVGRGIRFRPARTANARIRRASKPATKSSAQPRESRARRGPAQCESASALTPNPAVPASRRSRAGRGAGMATGNRRIRASTARRCNNAPATVRSDPAREQQDREDASRGPNERSRRTRRHSRHQGDKHPGRQASARGQSAEQADPRARKRHAATPAGSRREAQRRP